MKINEITYWGFPVGGPAATQQRIKQMSNASEQELMDIVKQNPSAIFFIQNPSEQVQLAAVNRRPYVIKNIKNPTDRVLLMYLEKKWRLSDNLDKTKVIPELLRYVKTEDWTFLLPLILALKLKGYDWPELDTFEKSARKELANED